MALKEEITAANEAAIFVQTGDLEIANDALRTSNWLSGMSTAGLYFCYSTAQQLKTNLGDPVFMYCFIGAAFLFGISLLSAFNLQRTHNMLSAYLRNLICAYKIQLSIALGKIDKAQFQQKLSNSNKPIWGLVTNGELSVILETKNFIIDLEEKTSIYRNSLNFWKNTQRKITLISFFILIALNSYLLLLSNT